MKYVAKLKDQPISSLTLANKEYKAHEDVIEVPDDHHEAHKAAKMIGLEHAPTDHAPSKDGTTGAKTKA